MIVCLRLSICNDSLIVLAGLSGEGLSGDWIVEQRAAHTRQQIVKRSLRWSSTWKTLKKCRGAQKRCQTTGKEEKIPDSKGCKSYPEFFVFGNWFVLSPLKNQAVCEDVIIAFNALSYWEDRLLVHHDVATAGALLLVWGTVQWLHAAFLFSSTGTVVHTAVLYCRMQPLYRFQVQAVCW